MIRDYSTEIALFWPAIERAWNDHADKQPIIECDLAKREVGAYPAKEYIAGLSERTRADMQKCYIRAIREGSMMLFIRDSGNQVLQSYVLQTPKEAEDRKT